ncbi:uncharacterized protein ASCRUDRAFT_80696 [Ascoidea rubescens DSM 1968]|uniref:Velvet domain-containing protein n=1 Tax=Ascoidea rubescens DSM 1968 TaxID=1344418 RepID=A0A1D2VJ51_9ASCO|nr:hypothetical protein ASCRUDRAFT_80696 [Ascoidea rubescens DSM 1968]ODV61662.1 hypothetical protein ASCRUDRAFT_80696 [Ascoidea rubescens DSM 1968]
MNSIKLNNAPFSYNFKIERQSICGRQSSHSTKRNLKGYNLVTLSTNNYHKDVKFLVCVYLLNEHGEHDELYQQYLDGQKLIKFFNSYPFTLNFNFSNLGIRKTGRWKLGYTLVVISPRDTENALIHITSNVIEVFSSKSYQYYL